MLEKNLEQNAVVFAQMWIEPFRSDNLLPFTLWWLSCTLIPLLLFMRIRMCMRTINFLWPALLHSAPALDSLWGRLPCIESLSEEVGRSSGEVGASAGSPPREEETRVISLYTDVLEDTQMVRYKLVSFSKDSKPNISHSNTTLWHSNASFIMLKLIYIISSN